MSIDLHSLAAELSTPDRTLAFCDDTDLTLKPTSTMVGDLHLYGGLIVKSEAYAPLALNLASYLAGIGQVEFHGTEIINPKTGSRWKALDYNARAEALRHVCTAITETSATFVYARICKTQYADLPKDVGRAIDETSYKAAVKRVFLRSVADYLAAGAPAVLVIDRDKNTPGPTLVKFEGSARLIRGGAISANSADVLGLQLADVVAYAIGRFLRQRDKIVATDPERYDLFDRIIMEIIGGLYGRLHDVIEPLPNLSAGVALA